MADQPENTPSAPPVTPAVPPVTPGSTGIDQFVPKVESLEDDPNHQLAIMIAKRKTRKTGEQAKTKEEEQATTESEPKQDEKPPKPADSEPPKKIGNLLSEALKFRQKKDKKADEAPKEGQPDGKTEGQGDAAKPAAAAQPAKSIVSKKKAKVEAQNPIEIATAAATAALQAVSPPKTQEPKQPRIEDGLVDEDRHEYEVAKYLASTNPKFKDAPKVVLDQVKAAEAYSQRWERENPGKIFDPNDESHDDFYETLRKPWQDHEFRTAEIEMAAERIAEKKARSSDEKLKEIERESAGVQLAPIIERTVTSAAGLLAQSVGQEIHDKIVKDGFEKFSESDPITADVLASTITPLQPMIEAIVQLDDPKGRFPYNENNPIHKQWLSFLLEKEHRFAGERNDDGKMFATRQAYSQMSEAQRASHWYLTPDHLLSELVLDASEMAKERIEKEKERQKKIAISLGYVPAPEKNGGSSGSTKGTDATTISPKHSRAGDPSAAVARANKPVSPSAGGSPKIDNTETSPKKGMAGVLAATHSILFPR